jgi:hypothetical protein
MAPAVARYAPAVMARIGPSPIMALGISVLIAACAFFGGEITVTARNDSDVEMVIQVVDGNGAAVGPAHRVLPLDGRDVELAIPGGAWDVAVNGHRLLTSSDAAGRTGRLPVTLILPAPDDPIGQPYWQAPSDWAGGD